MTVSEEGGGRGREGQIHIRIIVLFAILKIQHGVAGGWAEEVSLSKRGGE